MEKADSSDRTSAIVPTFPARLLKTAYKVVLLQALKGRMSFSLAGHAYFQKESKIRRFWAVNIAFALIHRYHWQRFTVYASSPGTIGSYCKVSFASSGGSGQPAFFSSSPLEIDNEIKRLFIRRGKIRKPKWRALYGRQKLYGLTTTRDGINYRRRNIAGDHIASGLFYHRKGAIVWPWRIPSKGVSHF